MRNEDTGKWHAPTLASRTATYQLERGQFASVASHDLREPLRTVNIYARSSGDSAAMSQKPVSIRCPDASSEKLIFTFLARGVRVLCHVVHNYRATCDHCRRASRAAGGFRSHHVAGIERLPEHSA